ncbi:restriction endonuclease-related protein [Arcticibacter svalbardensis MN12-7]|uniref:Restriction endonuclease-related protein n=1 Tax=Arcticibacter svalbardensis MN12-7 TaxID=1150600 RepID=R9GNB6_9SPHI|nr:type II restriction endonuclease [Arcticibacter svalbardensis]EOR93030.1 restriction endonuclease-related protein [Arcticibacter svalbardensis MN12-7]
MPSPLSDYFTAIGIKRLSQVEINPTTSNQHEFNGIKEFQRIFGSEKKTFAAKFLYLTDDQDEILEGDGFLTWYDSREKHVTRTEYRLYYSSNQVIANAKVNDLIIVGITSENNLAVIVAPQNSTYEKQLLWLFGVEEVANKFIIKDFTEDKKDIGFAGRFILSSFGMEQIETAPDLVDDLLKQFGNKFPSTKEFSDYSRSTVSDVSPVDSPDETLIAWLEREEMLFRTLEGVIVKEQLKKGFGIDGTDVDEFIKLSLSVQNRRKSRAGHSFEHNLAILFSINKIRYSHGAVTERNNKPDFLFPGISEYNNDGFDINLLTMLGVKTSAKDRWRQVLSEAKKIDHKHLITLEPSISNNQIEEMKANNLQLVIPAPLFSTYTKSQQKELFSVKDFMEMILLKQG